MSEPKSAIRDRSVGLRNDQWEALVAIAKREDLSVAHLVRRAVGAYLDKRRFFTATLGGKPFATYYPDGAPPTADVPTWEEEEE
jgi:hypothetical protein